VSLKVAGHVNVPEEDGVSLLHGDHFARPHVCRAKSTEGEAALHSYSDLHKTQIDRYGTEL